MADVFISYASVDLARASDLAQLVEQAGYSVWWDQHLRSGERFQQSIQRELYAASVVLVIWTQTSIRSEWVYSEARRGNQRGVLAQVRAEDVTIDDLPAPFDALHCPFVNDVPALLRAVETLVTSSPSATTQMLEEGDQSSVAPSEPSEFSPLHRLESQPTNLPAQPTKLLGRREEVSEVLHLLGHEGRRLVTLTGPGGTGKTRLALQAAADAVANYPDGVFLVSLASVTSPGLVLSAIAQTLGVREGQGRTVEEALREFLVERRLLLVLDNFEQIVAAGSAVAELMTRCPQLHVLVTSREPLRVPGEQEYAVPALPVPDLARLGDAAPDVLSKYDAVALFIERARSVRGDFMVDSDNALAVAEICVRLDGLPLAIELAAARINVLTPRAILDRLGGRLKLLTGGARNLPARQQTLRGTIDWSYELLSEPERRLFARLAVFVGGWRLEAAEVICDPDGSLDLDVLDGLASLVDKSLIRRDDSLGGEARFSMLETICEYSLERFRHEPAESVVRDAHAAYFADLAWSMRERLQTSDGGDCVSRLEEEHGNLRAAVERLMQTGSRTVAFQLLLGAWRAWLRSGRLSEGQAIFEQVLEQSPDLSEDVRFAELLVILGEFHRWQGNFRKAVQLKEKSLPVFRRHNARYAALTLADLGAIAVDEGRYDDGQILLDETLALGRRLGDRETVSHALAGLARLALVTGDTDRAGRLYEQELAAGRELGDDEPINDALTGLGWVALRQGLTGQADSLFRDALQVANSMQDVGCLLDTLAGAAAVLIERGEDRRAIQLLAAVEQGCTSTGNVMWFPDERDQQIEALREQVDAGQFEQAWAAGLAMSPDQAADLVLGESSAASDVQS